MTQLKPKNVLWDAERLAQFSNADGTMELERFRANNEGFFPRNFENWQVPQTNDSEPILTTDAASAEAVRRLKREPPIRFWRAFQHVLHDAWREGFPLEESVRLISCIAVPDRLSGKSDVEPDLLSFPVWPCQRAVMFLGVETWRARFCAQCGKRFVADKPARRFCSNACAAKARKHSKKVWWTEKGNEWRADYEKKNAKKKGKRSRRVTR
jgi:hypothetical protein